MLSTGSGRLPRSPVLHAVLASVLRLTTFVSPASVMRSFVGPSCCEAMPLTDGLWSHKVSLHRKVSSTWREDANSRIGRRLEYQSFMLKCAKCFFSRRSGVINTRALPNCPSFTTALPTSGAAGEIMRKRSQGHYFMIFPRLLSVDPITDRAGPQRLLSGGPIGPSGPPSCTGAAEKFKRQRVPREESRRPAARYFGMRKISTRRRKQFSARRMVSSRHPAGLDSGGRGNNKVVVVKNHRQGRVVGATSCHLGENNTT